MRDSTVGFEGGRRQKHARVIAVLEQRDHARVHLEITWRMHRTSKPDPYLPSEVRGVLCLRTSHTELTAVSGVDPWYPAEDAFARQVARWVVDNRELLAARADAPAASR
jgi:hypothetical protein